eukprot:gene3398-4274_t
MAELQNRLLQSQAATAEAVRESEFGKRVTQAIGLTKADNDLQKLGGALAGAAAGGTHDQKGKAVHFEIAGDSDDGRKKKKKGKKRSKSSKKKKKHSSSDSDSSTTTDTSDSRRSRQRRKREKGADLARATQSDSGQK